MPRILVIRLSSIGDIVLTTPVIRCLKKQVPDAEVHVLQGPGGVLLPRIEAAFPGTTGPQGVDRARLGAAVFGNPAALEKATKELNSGRNPGMSKRGRAAGL